MGGWIHYFVNNYQRGLDFVRGAELTKLANELFKFVLAEIEWMHSKLISIIIFFN